MSQKKNNNNNLKIKLRRQIHRSPPKAPVLKHSLSRRVDYPDDATLPDRRDVPEGADQLSFHAVSDYEIFPRCK